MSNSSSKTGSSVERLTIVARSAARNASRSIRPVTSDALKASSVSASETRTPFSRSRFANSTNFSCIDLPPGPLPLTFESESASPSLVEQILVATGFGAAPRAHAPHVIFEFFLRLADVALVFDDRVERLGDEFLVEAVDVEQRQRLDPIERLADTGRLLQIELAERLHDRDDFFRKLASGLGHLELDDCEFLRAIGKVDVAMEASALERVRHFARVVRSQNHQWNMLGLERAEFGHS